MRRLLHTGTFMLLLLVLPSATAGTAAAAVPTGFTDTRVAGIPSPEGIAFTPDGRILVSAQTGQVRVIANGTLLATPAIDLSAKICNDKEGGLPGLAVDPSFASNHFVYLSYTFKKSGICEYGGTARSPVNRVSRFVLSNSNTIDPASEVVLLDNMPSPEGQHTAGDIQFGKDGFLYTSIGDGACDYKKDSGCFAANDAARDQNALVGKILRITRDGAIPPGNPFTGAGTGRCNTAGMTSAAKCQETFVWGFRNPFRIAFDPNATGTRFYINDVGELTWEEIDLAQAGADYGWNVREGFCATGSTTNCGPPPAGMTNPIFAYGRSTGCGAVTGGAFVPNGIWPSNFDNTYLFGDFNCGKIFQLVPAGGGGFTMQTFASGLGNVISMDFGPSAVGRSLYYTSYANGGELRRIDFVGSGGGTTATFNVAASGDDGDVKAAGASYPPAGTPVANTTGTVMTAGRRLVAGQFENLVPLLRFNTASLPDNATITSATLRVHVTGKADANNRNLVGEWYPSANWPIDSADYALSSPATALPATDIGQLGVGVTDDLALIGLSSISKTGFTALRLQVDGGQPAGDNYVQMAAFDNASLPQPQLIVTYTTGQPPANTAPPAISGSPAVGQKLTASTGTWSGAQPMSFAYQWQRCDSGGTCTDIGGATSNQYLLASADTGFRIRVRVTATNGSGSASATSQMTAVVSNGSNTITFSVLTSGDDGDVTARGSTYPPTGAPIANTNVSFITAGRRLVGGNFENILALLRFNTSALPDNAHITSATLRVSVTAKADGNGRNLVGAWYPSANWPIDAGDYALSINGDAFSADITALPAQGRADLPLAGLGSISLTGMTGLRLEVDGGQPTADNYVQMAAFDNATVAEAQLIVTYA